MALSPLWSCLTFGSPLSNAEVENHFLSVKRGQATGTRPLMASFIAKHYKKMKCRLTRLVRENFQRL